MNRPPYFNSIEEKLNTLAVRINSRGRLNLLEIHGHSESFYQYFLKEIYGWDVTNANDTKQNIEAIDLIDNVNKFVIQVSATSTKQKIESSLSKDSIKDYKGYTFKFISIANDADDLRDKIYQNPHKISFTPSSDIIDKNSILSTIKGLHIDGLKKTYNFVKKELGTEIDPMKLESNLASIINILSKEDLDNLDPVAEISSFEIDRKISYNKLNSAKLVINDYTVHQGRVEKIYSEFDKQGHNKSNSVLCTIRQEYAKEKTNLTDDQLFFEIIAKVQKKVLNSSNYTSTPLDELELCINILVVDAFIRCKIFENPNNYNYATS